LLNRVEGDPLRQEREGVEITMASDNTKQFSEDNFESEVVQSDLPVLVDFWAEWCGPCRMIAPIIEEIAGETQGKLKVGKVDVDSNNSIASTYGIQSIPTLMLFVGGEVKERITGAKPKAQIMAQIAPHITGS